MLDKKLALEALFPATLVFGLGVLHILTLGNNFILVSKTIYADSKDDKRIYMNVFLIYPTLVIWLNNKA
jgi:hypothetical protein